MGQGSLSRSRRIETRAWEPGEVAYRITGDVEEWLTCVAKARKGNHLSYVFISVNFRLERFDEGTEELSALTLAKRDPAVVSTPAKVLADTAADPMLVLELTD